MTADPIFTLLPYPGDVMDRSMGNAQIPASSISFANTFGVLFTVVLYDLALVPLANRLKRPISMTLRIGIGFVVQLAALTVAALIEMARYRAISAAGLRESFAAAGPDADMLDAAFQHPMRCGSRRKDVRCTTVPPCVLFCARVYALSHMICTVGLRGLKTSQCTLAVALLSPSDVCSCMPVLLSACVLAASGGRLSPTSCLAFQRFSPTLAAWSSFTLRCQKACARWVRQSTCSALQLEPILQVPSMSLLRLRRPGICGLLTIRFLVTTTGAGTPFILGCRMLLRSVLA